MRILWTMLLFAVIVEAQKATVTQYEVDLSLFGKIGTSTITIAEDDKRYVMIVEDRATGMAAKISGNEHDRFISRGHKFEDRYISDVFEERQKNDATTETNVFMFDHDAKTLIRYQDKNETVTETTFDVFSMGLTTKTEHKRKKEQKVLDYYSEYDALSVVLNIPHLIALAPRVGIHPVGLSKKGRKIFLSRVKMDKAQIADTFDSPRVVTVVQLDSIENDDEYGVFIGYNENGGIEEVVTKKTYFVIGYGRIVKIGERKADAAVLLHRYFPETRE